MADGPTIKDRQLPKSKSEAPRRINMPANSSEYTAQRFWSSFIKSPRKIGLWLGGLFTCLVLVISTLYLTGSNANNISAPDLQLGGIAVGNLSPENVRRQVDRYAKAFADSDITIMSDGASASASPEQLGIEVDIETTTSTINNYAKSKGGLSEFLRWLNPFDAPTKIPAALNANLPKFDLALAELFPDRKRPPVIPGVKLVDNQLEVVAAQSSVGIKVESALAEITSNTKRALPISIEMNDEPITPRFSNDEARSLVEKASAITESAVRVRAGNFETRIDSKTVRSWVSLRLDDNRLALDLNRNLVDAALPNLLAPAERSPTDARFVVNATNVSVASGTTGIKCCANNSAEVLRSGLFEGGSKPLSPIEIPMLEVVPKTTESELRDLKIQELVSTFTTQHPAGQERVKNIHKVADLTRGKVIAPGQSFSLNEFLGERTLAKGYVVAPVIEDGKFAASPGGGISQFVTTLFNAAFFAALEIPEYQAHSIYISRYPYGREATLSWPKPDLVIRNQSPYGVMIWPTYTSTSITVNLYSTRWASAIQSGQTTGASGSCTIVSTERTTTFLDGATKHDRFRARYQSGEGIACADPVSPPSTPLSLPSSTVPTTSSNTTIQTPSSTVGSG